MVGAARTRRRHGHESEDGKRTKEDCLENVTLMTKEDYFGKVKDCLGKARLSRQWKTVMAKEDCLDK